MRCLLACLLLLSLNGVARAEILLAGGDQAFPPFEYIDAEGQAAGFNVELIQALAAAMGRTAEVRLGPWAQARAAITRGEIDILPMFFGEFRATDVDFATPHTILYHEFFLRRGTAPLSGIDDLSGLDIIVQQDSWAHEKLRHERIDANLILVDSEPEAIALLATGAHDVAIVNGPLGRRLLARPAYADLVTSGPPLFAVDYALAVPKGRDELRADINRAIEQLKSSGEFQRMHERWLGQTPAELQPQPRAGAAIWIWLAVLVLAAAILVLVRRRRRIGRLAPPLAADPALFQDALTGLPNRLGLERQLRELDRSLRNERQLIHIDLDQFRIVNETTNHRAGDQVIRAVVERIRAELEPSDFLARTAGDEFCLLCKRQDLDEASALAERLRRRIESLAMSELSAELDLTASIGVAALQVGGADHIGEFLKQAEAACQAAKQAGRNRVHRYHPEDEALAERDSQLRWVVALRRALKEDRLALYWQPIETARPDPDAKLVVELLLRLIEVDGKVVSAGEFMPAAERYFLAQQVDRWVLQHALRWLTEHADALENLERVNINISAQSLGDDRFLPFVLEQLDRHPGIAERVCIEITETAIITQLETGLTTMHLLRERGLRFSMDDFGVGNSSMALLQQLPVDEIKIDGSFIRQADVGERERRLIAEINELGHLLGKTTVAEMVETREHRELMASIGVNRVQGWAIGRPQPLDLLPTTLQDRLAQVG